MDGGGGGKQLHAPVDAGARIPAGAGQQVGVHPQAQGVFPPAQPLVDAQVEGGIAPLVQAEQLVVQAKLAHAVDPVEVQIAGPGKQRLVCLEALFIVAVAAGEIGLVGPARGGGVRGQGNAEVVGKVDRLAPALGGAAQPLLVLGVFEEPGMVKVQMLHELTPCLALSAPLGRGPHPQSARWITNNIGRRAALVKGVFRARLFPQGVRRSPRHRIRKAAVSRRVATPKSAGFPCVARIRKASGGCRAIAFARRRAPARSRPKAAGFPCAVRFTRRPAFAAPPYPQGGGLSVRRPFRKASGARRATASARRRVPAVRPP